VRESEKERKREKEGASIRENHRPGRAKGEAIPASHFF
jgi:hypothetical protein